MVAVPHHLVNPDRSVGWWRAVAVGGTICLAGLITAGQRGVWWDGDNSAFADALVPVMLGVPVMAVAAVLSSWFWRWPVARGVIDLGAGACTGWAVLLAVGGLEFSQSAPTPWLIALWDTAVGVAVMFAGWVLEDRLVARRAANSAAGVGGLTSLWRGRGAPRRS